MLWLISVWTAIVLTVQQYRVNDLLLFPTVCLKHLPKYEKQPQSLAADELSTDVFVLLVPGNISFEENMIFSYAIKN